MDPPGDAHSRRCTASNPHKFTSTIAQGIQWKRAPFEAGKEEEQLGRASAKKEHDGELLERASFELRDVAFGSNFIQNVIGDPSRVVLGKDLERRRGTKRDIEDKGPVV